MNYEDVQKVSNAAKNKIGLLNTSFLKYFLRAVMAGFFIDVAVIYSNVAGNVFSGSDPAWGKFLGALVFSIAVLLLGGCRQGMAGELPWQLCWMCTVRPVFRMGRSIRHW